MTALPPLSKSNPRAKLSPGSRSGAISGRPRNRAEKIVQGKMARMEPAATQHREFNASCQRRRETTKHKTGRAIESAIAGRSMKARPAMIPINSTGQRLDPLVLGDVHISVKNAVARYTA